MRLQIQKKTLYCKIYCFGPIVIFNFNFLRALQASDRGANHYFDWDRIW
jgi:hypothetical protein